MIVGDSLGPFRKLLPFETTSSSPMLPLLAFWLNHVRLERSWHLLGKWNGLAALGTLLLASATVWLGKQARREGQEAARALETSIRPVIVDVPSAEAEVTHSREGSTIVVEIPVFNAGAGLAIISDMRAKKWFQPITLQVKAVLDQTAVPSSHRSRLDLHLQCPDEQQAREVGRALGTDDASFSVEIEYTDMNGKQSAMTTMHIAHSAVAGGLYVESLDLYGANRKKPFAHVSGRSSSTLMG
jgi:hypothetical protein